MDAPQFWRWAGSPVVRPAGHPECAVILPNLLVGEYPTPADALWLRAERGVTAVLSLQDDADLASKGLELAEITRAYEAHALRFHRMPVPDCDNEVLAARLDAIVGLLDELLSSGERVYLHCNAGMNRAPTVAIAYLHSCRDMPLSAARDFVKDRRSCVPYMRVLETHYNGRTR
ncbi:MAG TPA: dual specificity protein phosphatase family protein [Candidatus Acidoferrales bacterium]|nr:dual specificity protein phosphatase family protein [Candidatus Acidoferrales bacterium]